MGAPALLLRCLMCAFKPLPNKQIADFDLSKESVEGAAVSSVATATNPRWLGPEVLRGEKPTAASGGQVHCRVGVGEHPLPSYASIYTCAHAATLCRHICVWHHPLGAGQLEAPLGGPDALADSGGPPVRPPPRVAAAWRRPWP